ncbi:diacylglycerol O-acyltransferase [Ilumatobacter fluminis]|uniref:diacylglycerol O-acyltransferase n=1 Tax=Ilumatobacter fluminis TaxID=467091 RepID=A0A4R7I022_9ACTN|nr:wax ester/triacylglycerol synthase domain-containing protein [Ilumatobacter fluminis]TDT16867.1 diacylglycerol O-acyltransferase [Ilumatobacter fluminis]
MTELEHDDWMGDSDAVLWHIERDPILRSTITSVWFLDRVPDGARLRLSAERMVEALPRLRQHVVDAQPGLAAPRWADDPLFDLDHHVRSVSIVGDERAVLDYAERLATTAFDKDRPLWELEVVEGLPGGRGAFVMKVHHAIADGIGLVKMLAHIVSFGPDDDGTAGRPPERARSERSAEHPWAATIRAVRHRVATDTRALARLGTASLHTAAGFVRDPIGTASGTTRTAGSIAKLIQPATTPRSPIMTGRSLTLRLHRVEVELDPVREAARALGASLNDAFVAVVLEALHEYHRHHGVDAADIRMHMPVSVRSTDGDGADAITNQFVPARFVLPLGDRPLAERVVDTTARLAEVRAEPALPHVNDIAGIVERLGPTATVTLIGSMMKGVDVTTSNVPGPPFPVYLAGAKAEQMFAYGPPAGSAINLTLLSYDGTLEIGITTDHAALPDPEVFVTAVEAAFDHLLTT